MQVVPLDIWAHIRDQLEPWETNPYLFIKLSHISKSARDYFLSDSVWKALNPYQRTNTSGDFIRVMSTLSADEQNHMQFVWKAVQKTYHASGILETGMIDEVHFELLRDRIPSVRSDASLYYKLGLLVATAFSVFRIDLQKYQLNNAQLVSCAAQIVPAAWLRGSNEIRESTTIALEAIKTPSALFPGSSWRSLRGAFSVRASKPIIYVMPMFHDDRDIMLAAVESNAESFFYSSERLKRDRDYVLEAIERNCRALKYVDNIYKREKQIVMKSIAKERSLLAHIDADIASQREVLMAAFEPLRRISTGGTSRFYVHPLSVHLKDRALLSALDDIMHRYADHSTDKSLLQRMVAWNGLCLKYASPDLRKDRELVSIAVAQDGLSLKFVDKDFEIDRELAYAAISSRPASLSLLNFDYRDDYELVRDAIEINGVAYIYSSPRLRQVFQLYSKAVATYPLVMDSNYCPASFLEDRELATVAIKQDGRSILKTNMLQDKELALLACANRGNVLVHLPSELQDDFDVVLAAVSNDGMAISGASSRLRSNKIIAHAALYSCGTALPYLEGDISVDRDIVDFARLRLGWTEIAPTDFFI